MRELWGVSVHFNTKVEHTCKQASDATKHTELNSTHPTTNAVLKSKSAIEYTNPCIQRRK